MPNIIDKSFFVGDLEIAQTTQVSVETNLNAFIASKEPEYLRLLLGDDLAVLFIATPSNYVAIRDGLVDINLPSIKRYIACYVYFFWMRQQSTMTTGSGEKTVKVQHSVDSTPYFKACRAWNEMVDYNRRFREYAKTYQALYTDPYNMYAPSWSMKFSTIRKRNGLFHVINPTF